MGSVVFVALLGLILLLNRRNKALWTRLQNGYTVQSQSDLQPGAPTRSASPPMAQKNTRYHWFSRRPATIEPYPFFSGDHTRFSQTLAMPTHHRNQTGSGSLYQPYAGFGKSKYIPIGGSNDDHTSRGEVQRESDPHGVPLSAPLSNSTHEPTPQRSETILTTVTVSTLVAEDGREPLTDELADMTFVKDPVWEAKRTIRRGAMNVTTPTPSHYRVSDSNLGSHRVPSTKLNSRPRSRSILLSGTRSFRLSQQSSRFPTPHRSRHTRSSSSTEVHLLHRDDDGNPAAGSDLGFDEEDDHDRVFEYDDFEESADFYVQDVRELVARLRLSTSSVPRSQSDAHTPIRGRSEEFDYSASGLRFSRRLTERENVLGASRLSPIQADFSQHIQLDPNPHRQTSDDTLPPKYTSRAPSLDCPPPFVVA
ncbi:hypothetical protein C8R42DRAFT_448819 [Lentinula raphanica]|nr:hypothetical protein C8R42DRAFT_448819 [Lentinula raphanica]